MLQNITSFFGSAAFGLLLKVCTGIAAAAFAILGVGAETRDKDGRLNTKGWIALVGILVAALLAIATASYEYRAEKQKAQIAGLAEEAAKKESERLALDVKRNLYPLKGRTLAFNLTFDKTSKIATDYTKTLDAAIAKDPECKKTKLFECWGESSGGGSLYHIQATSPLYPLDGTLMRGGIETAA
jgi:type II secretory pathway pseudopilin PulG